MRARSTFVVLVTVWALTACDFFQELESLPDAGEDESGASGESGESGESGDTADTEGEPCTVLDDHCSDQDTLHYCSPQTGALETQPCGAFCSSGGLLNFTCTPTESFQHGCWCVTPGDFKLYTCVELETCVVECGDPDSDCAIECFTRTDPQTIRLLGTLYSCADLACDELCANSPADCGSCLLAARAGLWGNCGIAREVCNADQSDEPSWP